MQAISLSGITLGNCAIRVLPSKTAIQPSSQSMLPPSTLSMENADKIQRTIYVGSVDTNITEKQLMDFFGNCGSVVKLCLAGDIIHAARFAFIEFATVESAKQALVLNGALLGDRPIRVNPSKTPIYAPPSPSAVSSCWVAPQTREAMKKVSEAQEAIVKRLGLYQQQQQQFSNSPYSGTNSPYDYSHLTSHVYDDGHLPFPSQLSADSPTNPFSPPPPSELPSHETVASKNGSSGSVSQDSQLRAHNLLSKMTISQIQPPPPPPPPSSPPPPPPLSPTPTTTVSSPNSSAVSNPSSSNRPSSPTRSTKDLREKERKKREKEREREREREREKNRDRGRECERNGDNSRTRSRSRSRSKSHRTYSSSACSRSRSVSRSRSSSSRKDRHTSERHRKNR
eukprot:TRINITY_DN5140_c0_g1_i3.p1 TRINITY_DN5140_c0_g1~~TRINITY_DN5140_c0_g1_i3.p1  ORF type:complete len:397 (+),score=81.85 TRINITY_DN5140_c0_g1_i3:567-1757(+)